MYDLRQAMPPELKKLLNTYDDSIVEMQGIMLEEYYKQQGFNKKQIKEFKEKRNNIFRDLEDIYKEPIYNDTDN